MTGHARSSPRATILLTDHGISLRSVLTKADLDAVASRG